MSSRRPPPLPKSLFSGSGPLAPGTAPLPPSPATIHPSFIVDAHTFAPPSRPVDSLFASLPESFPKPSVKSAVQVVLDVSADPPQAVLGVKPFLIHPTILNLTLATPPSITNIAKGAVEIILPCTRPLNEKEWDLLDEAVNALDGSWAKEGETGGKIVISGLLPPPMTESSSSVHRSESYSLHIGRLTQLSLHGNVYLKALPPIVDASRAGNEANWWNDITEVERVVRMYLSPAIETFGTHRLIFGSSPALPLVKLSSTKALEQPVSSGEWYALLRKCFAGLGEDTEAVTGLMGANAERVYELS